MPTICPTITAYSEEEYGRQMEKIAGFASRIQVDLTDGIFTKEQTVGSEQAWWPAGIKADLHLMYEDPQLAISRLIGHNPNLIIVQAESKANLSEIADYCHGEHVRFGIALLPDTPAEAVLPYLGLTDHALIFSGNLGYQGGSHADLSLLEKAKFLKTKKPELEIGWDGGVNDQNIAALVTGGVDILNVGGFLQNSPDPLRSFAALQRIADETGTT